ncbi:SWIRM-domain-containing protein [Hesseltinella vesiculosa]|uniref:SWIRM-domain-containing protein n=1 Tax=Hesseltinella vesiculosa TaxID=101127 RepID=A0A1X2GNG0_9FUNG|nr:SWIRM-domain-containing protein [Hesseltinella vesiculosa]
MVFFGDDTEQDIRLKLVVLDIYNTRLDTRRECKRFVIERNWLDFRQQRLQDRKKSKTEKRIIKNTRVLSRLQTSQDYDSFVHGLVQEYELRHRIAELQEWRSKAGVTTLDDGEAYQAARHDRIARLRTILEASHQRLLLTMNQMPQGNEQLRESLSRKSGLPSPLPPKLPSQSSQASPLIPSCLPTKITPPPVGRKPANPLDISQADGIELLSTEEQTLCSTLRLLPRPYLVIKNTILREYEKQGFLKRRATRALIKIDVNKTSRIYDFFIERGWISAAKKE